MKKKVLIVDDNKGMVGLLKEYFMDSKTIEITDVAYNGEEGWEKIKNNYAQKRWNICTRTNKRK